MFLYFNDTATTAIYTLSLHDALPIWTSSTGSWARTRSAPPAWAAAPPARSATRTRSATRSEEHTSELQSQSNLVCRLLLEKKNCLVTECASSHILRFVVVTERLYMLMSNK